jgi:gas vesicle protein
MVEHTSRRQGILRSMDNLKQRREEQKTSKDFAESIDASPETFLNFLRGAMFEPGSAKLETSLGGDGKSYSPYSKYTTLDPGTYFDATRAETVEVKPGEFSQTNRRKKNVIDFKKSMEAGKPVFKNIAEITKTDEELANRMSKVARDISIAEDLGVLGGVAEVATVVPSLIKGVAKVPGLVKTGVSKLTGKTDDFVYQTGLRGAQGREQKAEIFDRIINNPEKREKFIDMVITNKSKFNYKDVKEAFPEFASMPMGTYRKEYLQPIRNELLSKGLGEYGDATKMLLDTGAIKELQQGFIGEEAVKKIIKLHGKGVSPSAIANTLEGTVPITGQALLGNVINYTKRGGFLDNAFKKNPDFFGKNYKPKYFDEKIKRTTADSGTKPFAVREIDETWFDPSVAEGYFLTPQGTPLKLGSLGDKQRRMSGGLALKNIFPFLKAAPGTTQAGTKSSIALLPETGHRFPGITSIKMDDPLQYTDVKIQTTAINQKLFASQKGGSLDGVINNKVDTIQQLLKGDEALKDPDILAAVNKNIDDINKIYDESYEMMYKTFGGRVSRDVFPTLSIQGDRLVLSNPGSLLAPKSTTQFFKDYFYDVAATLNLSNDVARTKFGMTADQMLNQFRQHAKNKFPKASTKVWEDIVDSLRRALKETDETKKSKLLDEADKLIEESAKKADTGESLITRTDFQEGTQDITSFDQFGDVPGTVNASIKAVQEQVKSMYNDERVDFITEPIERYQLEAAEVREELQKRLNPPQPVKFKFSELPKLVTESPVLRSFLGDPRVYALETAELFYNGIRPGVENDVEMEKLFPSLYAMHNLATGTGVDPTPKEQTYISLIDELNRAQEKGFANFGYNVADLLLSIPDAVLPTQFTEEVKRQYEDMDLAEPETFIGNLGALIVEYGIPGSIGFKIINRFRKSISAATKGKADKYLFTRKTYGLEGLPKYGVQISNVAKRVGSTSLAFGAADFVAGGPYNTLTEMFDDPLLSDKLVGQLEDVENLTGKERVAANFRNRLRYGAEGAMIGGLFPLVGPALGAIGKNVLLKPALFLGKYGVVYPANYLAIKPITYLASKDPVVLPGIARGAGAFAQFLGKDVIARLAATAATGGKAFVPSLKGNLGQLPDFQQWRMFDVASNDPLERGLRKVDNFLKWFRDSGNQALYSFNLSGGAERFIKAKSREIEKYLDAIERKSYDLANGFLKRYNQSTTSPAGERHMLEQVYEYLRGNLKLSKLEPELQEISKSLKTEFDQIKKAFVGELPEGSGLRAFLESNLDKYMRASFAVFTNPRFTPADDIVEKATDFMVNVINKNEDFIEAAIKGVPVTEQAQAIRAFAKTNVENMISLGRREGIDPIEVLKQINRQILRDDDTIVQTGEELPKVIRELLGQEKSLRASVMTTASSLVTQTSNLRAFKEVAKHGLENGYLFTSRAEALAAGVTDPRQIGNLPGLGGLQDLATVDKDGPIGLFASNELKQTIEGTGGMLDSLLQNSFYQSLIAYKAGVQTGKTVFSPATQTRNFGSAGFFPLNVGHIGGNASVTDAFKIVMDDIFGAGRVVNESDLIKRISRKIELGVLDENIVASELSAILNDIKGGKLKALGALSERVDSSKLFKTATRVYAGGDNVWKWYGHEFYMSQLKGAFKSFDDVKRYMQDFHGVDISQRNIFGGGIKNLDEGIEEAAAYLLRETYPTYSKVPEFIKAIRKLPIGNFVSFTSEILRTSFATSAIALKHIASDNAVLREMGYRSLAGQAITLGGVTTGVQGLAHAMTNVTPTQLEVYKEYFAPDYMKFSSLVPVTNVEDGVFEVFDISRYHPYDIVTSSARELLKVADRQFHDERIAKLTEDLKAVDPGSPEGKRIREQIKELSIKARMGQTLDPDKITINALTQYLNAVGPLYNAVTGTFFGIPIGAEAFLEASRGKTLEGSTIWNTNMPPTEIFDRAMGHFFKTIEPGLISSGRKLLYAARGDVSGVGQPLEISTEGFKLMGGSNVKVDILGSLDFKISGDFLASFREPKMGRDYYDTANFQQRGPEQIVREYRKQNEDAFRMQYEFYKAAEAAIDSGLLTRTQIIQALQKRIAPDSKSISQKVAMFVSGRYTPITYGPEGLKSRREKIIRRNPDLDQSIFNYQYFLPIGLLEREKARWTGLRFEEFERQQETQQQSAVEQPAETPVAAAPEIQTPPVQETGSPVVAPQPVAGANPMTGLTTTETALLSPGEAAIRQKQRATGIV